MDALLRGRYCKITDGGKAREKLVIAKEAEGEKAERRMADTKG
jgi:hypothetical protein